MKCRIAVASTDGKVVNQHFGKADIFYILEADTTETDKFEVVEIRKTGAFCEGGEHSDVRLREVIENINDCGYVLVSRIGQRAQNEVEAAGIQVYELPGIISESVEELLKHIEIQNLIQELSNKRAATI